MLPDCKIYHGGSLWAKQPLHTSAAKTLRETKTVSGWNSCTPLTVLPKNINSKHLAENL